MTVTDLTPRLPEHLTTGSPHRTTITWRPQWRQLVFDSWYSTPEVEAVEILHGVGIAHRWNGMTTSAKRLGLITGAMAGDYVGTFLTAGEDPEAVARAITTAWVDNDTAAVQVLTAARIAALPPVSDYRRGQDIHVRFPDGTCARVWSYPKRGAYHVWPHGNTAASWLRGTSEQVADLAAYAAGEAQVQPPGRRGSGLNALLRSHPWN